MKLWWPFVNSPSFCTYFLLLKTQHQDFLISLINFIQGWLHYGGPIWIMFDLTISLVFNPSLSFDLNIPCQTCVIIDKNNWRTIGGKETKWLYILLKVESQFQYLLPPINTDLLDDAEDCLSFVWVVVYSKPWITNKQRSTTAR